MRILIAEDDPVSRRLLEALLSKWGYEVVIASNGEEALKILQDDDAPRLAVLDWMMPGIDGVEVCREIRKLKEKPYTYILLLTAKSQKEDLIEGLDAGADNYLKKPFDPLELSAHLRAGRRILDLQAELMNTQEMLWIQATHDPLTNLPNRLLFSDRLTQRLTEARRQGNPLGVLFLDLDGFKYINDTLGHTMGDMMLKELSERLKHCLREVDTVARMGGDEFIVILSDISCSDDAARVARKIFDALSEPFILEGNDVFASVSIGISMYPADGMDAETLVRNADTAMYRAKEKGGNSYQLYTESLNAAAAKRMMIENNLRKAISKNELRLHYQPRVDLRTGRTLGMEALLRWQHPTMGMVEPEQFIPLAEDTGLIIPIGEWALREACRQNKAWQDEGFEPMNVSVNLSVRQLQRDGLVETVKKALADTGLDPSYLSLEVTESAIMHNMELANKTLNELKSEGIGILIDDFGTGYSSLNCLRQLPMDTIKIDRSFIKDLTSSPNDAAIAGAIVAMAHSLKLRVIAEGVETREQLDFLRSLNCDEMQGYFILPPVSSERFLELLWNTRGIARRMLDKAA